MSKNKDNQKRLYSGNTTENGCKELLKAIDDFYPRNLDTDKIKDQLKEIVEAHFNNIFENSIEVIFVCPKCNLRMEKKVVKSE